MFEKYSVKILSLSLSLKRLKEIEMSDSPSLGDKHVFLSFVNHRGEMLKIHLDTIFIQFPVWSTDK